MPHGYCTECQARVTVAGDRCLLGHPIDVSTISSERGRRARHADESRHRRSRPARADRSGVHRPSGPQRALPDAPRPESGRQESTRREPFDIELDLADDLDHERVPVGVATGEQPAVRLEPPPASAPPPRTPSPSGLVELNPTTETVEKLWDNQPVQPLEEWAPSEFVEAPRVNTSLLITVVLIAFAVFALWTGVSELIARQDARLEAIHEDTLALADVIASTNPDTARDRLDEIDTYARAVFNRAEDLDLGEPDRALAIEAAGTALELERSLGDAYAYQTAFEAVIERPALPTSAEPDQAGEAAENLVMWATALDDVLAGAPDGEAFTGHREAAAEVQAGLESLRTSYLDALRAGDSRAASGALIELDSAVGALRDTLPAAVADVADDTEQVAQDIRRSAGRMSASEE